MSWHYSQALVAAYSAATNSAGAPSAPSSLTHTPETCSSPGKTTAACPHFQSGTMCEPSTATNGMDLLTWFRADSRAKISVSREKEQVLTEPNLAFGGKWRELSARFDRDLCLWKTHRSLFIEALPESLVILPRWGLMRDGVLWGRTMPVHLTSVIESGYVPTPQARDHKGSSSNSKKGVTLDLPTFVKQNGLIPTPTVNGNNNRRGLLAKSGDGLATWARQYPTPCAADACRQGNHGDGGPTLPGAIGGPLNPMWVEWLMGFPPGWTELDASVMPKSQRKLRSRGERLSDSNEKKNVNRRFTT